jgi:4-hydroxy-3-methylbut-2-enyl diphosphate reductase
VRLSSGSPPARRRVAGIAPADPAVWPLAGPAQAPISSLEATVKPRMKLILANPRGFCAGVYMAIDVVDQLLDICPDETICVYHEIVHNRHVVDRFRHRGVRFVETIEEVPDGSIVVFSAHGVSPAIRAEAKAKRLTSIDATCPLVTKVHAEAIRYARKGYQIFLVGHADHQEVVGTRGEAPDAIQVVQSPEDIPNLVVRDPAKLAYLTQTTLSLDDAKRIIDALKVAFPLIKDPPSEDICYATTNRQTAVRAIAPDVDLVLVVGSRNSSNSVRLTEIAENRGTKARLIDDRSELDPSWFDGVGSVLVTAGASAPEDLVKDLVLHLVEQYGAEVEQHDVYREEVEFGLPGTLKELMRRRGIDPAGRRIRMDLRADFEEWLHSRNIPMKVVDLTVGATG